jgi:hypothetical protein
LTASTIPISRDTLHDSVAAVQMKAALPAAAGTDLWIFRDGRKEVSGTAMVRDLGRRVKQPNSKSVLDSLIEAGELEAALCDAAAPGAVAAAKLTDALADAVFTGNHNSNLAELVARIEAPDRVSVSAPEGFTYYALHPLDFSKIADRVPTEPRACAIIGIRSIGTTLSAMTAAGLRAKGYSVSRITVRPTGHPYARTMRFNAEAQWIQEQQSRAAQFLIVDEGPGRSGSTFLSVSEALLNAGVLRESISILGSRQVDPQSLCAEDAPTRWPAFRFLATEPSVNTRFEQCHYIGGGEWRKWFSGSDESWPESWTQMERLKFLSADRQTFFKFEGMGPMGAEVRERAFALAEVEFSPSVSDAGDGFLAYSNLRTGHLGRADINTAVLKHIARYCAFRASRFPYEQSDPGELRRMLEFNVQQEFGSELSLDSDAVLSEHPVLVDGRMQPYEWIATTSGQLLKTDAISHGDNHFFPGPCDIAWDVAGAGIEWQLGPDAISFLVDRLRQLSGIDVSHRLRVFMLAYAVFRLGFCKMALSTVRGSPEEGRLLDAYFYYRRRAERLLESSPARR